MRLHADLVPLGGLGKVTRSTVETRLKMIATVDYAFPKGGNGRELSRVTLLVVLGIFGHDGGPR